MPGNSQRRGAMRKPGTKKGATVGSGGQRSKGLEGRKATPPAEERTGHPKARIAARAARGRAEARSRRPASEPGETVLGRNPTVECLRAGVPATALHVAVGIDVDDRVTESVRIAADRGISILEVPRGDLDRLAGGALHQGLALQVPPYAYAHPDELLVAAKASGRPPLLVALDGVTDPRNLGAVVRSAAAFGAHGVVVPQRRAAGMTAVAWRTSAGTAARLPVARATNLTRTLKDWASAGLMIVGLDTEGSESLDDFHLAEGPLVLVIGSEGRGISRLVRETCDSAVRVPTESTVESLNASVAAGVVLAEVARRRRVAAG